MTKPLTHPDDLNDLFYKAYHNPNLLLMCNGIILVLDHDNVGTGIQENTHLLWLRAQATRLAMQYEEDPTHELHPMMYGMITDAWNKFLADYRIFYEEFVIMVGQATLKLLKERDNAANDPSVTNSSQA